MADSFSSAALATSLSLNTGTTTYYEIPVIAGEFLSVQLVWHDTTTAFTAAISTTNQPSVLVSSTSALEWSSESGISLVGAAGGSTGSSMKHISYLCSRRARIAITTTANSVISIWVHGKA